MRLWSLPERGEDRTGEGAPGLAKGQPSSPWHRRPQVSHFWSLEPRALDGVDGTLASAGERGEGGGGRAGALPGDPGAPEGRRRHRYDPASESDRGGSPVGCLGPGDDDANVDVPRGAIRGVGGLGGRGALATTASGAMGLRDSVGAVEGARREGPASGLREKGSASSSRDRRTKRRADDMDLVDGEASSWSGGSDDMSDSTRRPLGGAV